MKSTAACLISSLLMPALAGSDVAEAGPLYSAPRPGWTDVVTSYTCTIAESDDFVVFQGVVIDGEVRLDATGRNADPHQATIFRVNRKIKGDVPDRAKIWHPTGADSGVQFDYGKQYTVKAQKIEGEFETDICLMHDAESLTQE